MIQAVIQKLINDNGVKAVVGLNKAGDRYKVFPVVADQDEQLPYTVGSITGNNPNYCKDGAARQDVVGFQLITYAKEYEQADRIDNAIRFAIDSQKWTLANIPLSARLINTRDAFDNGKQCFARIAEYEADVKRNPPV